MYTGKKVRFRALDVSDLDNRMQWSRDREVMRFLVGGELPFSRAAEEAFIREAVSQHAKGNKYYTVETLDGEYIGAAGFSDIQHVNRRATIGLVIGRRDMHGQGYGTDTVRLLLHTAFHVYNLEKVTLKVFSNNHPAIACYRKCGFREVGRMKQHRFIDGEWHDEICMEINRSEWELSQEEGKQRR